MRPNRPTQTEFNLDDEGPLAPVEVTDGELARTVAEWRERGLWVWAMDVLKHGYRLHVRRAVRDEDP